MRHWEDSSSSLEGPLPLNKIEHSLEHQCLLDLVYLPWCILIWETNPFGKIWWYTLPSKLGQNRQAVSVYQCECWWGQGERATNLLLLWGCLFCILHSQIVFNFSDRIPGRFGHGEERSHSASCWPHAVRLEWVLWLITGGVTFLLQTGGLGRNARQREKEE